MKKYIISFLSSLFFLSIFCESQTIITATSNNFPDNFKFGAATAAYQIEGGWNEDGKGPSIWDTLTHNHPELVLDKSNGDISANSYHLFNEDIKALKYIGMNFYRFSISWSRILPNASLSPFSINEDGIKYYNNLINKLLENNIEPVITMMHYDFPQNLQDLGGMLNPIFIQQFTEYAKILFTKYGDRVKRWITFNEPFESCLEGYGTGTTAPLISESGIGEYKCAHNVIKSHASVYKLYYQDFYPRYNHGKIGITLDTRFYFSKTKNDDDVERAMNFELGWFANAIYSKNGNYPQIMIDEINKNSHNENRTKSRLPIFDSDEIEAIRGSADFLGLNYYSSRYVDIVINNKTNKIPSWLNDSGMKVSISDEWPRAKSSWLYSVPEGLTELLRWIKDNYNNVEVLITENGWSDDGELNDFGRIDYLEKHLNAIVKAINDYDCNVVGYTVWSIIDNFEWLRGYTEKFGLYNIDFTQPTRPRVAKKSANFMKEVIRTHSVSINEYL